ncbi:MAG: hypothetical protein GF364_20780, partial [Candidatus Lokiarchaeota archaeon]|nr:hypothetical protein [Candidatus Lokiarchaeota archaeon]
MSEGNKVAIIGLSNAGKTSIIKSLSREFHLLTNLKPTQGVNRETMEFLDKKLFLWDYGGQEIYRKRYIDAPDIFFNNVTYFFYVVDIQDDLLVDLNVGYFKLVWEELNKYSDDFEITIVFHKSDPGYDIEDSVVKTKFLKEVD